MDSDLPSLVPQWLKAGSNSGAGQQSGLKPLSGKGESATPASTRNTSSRDLPHSPHGRASQDSFNRRYPSREEKWTSGQDSFGGSVARRHTAGYSRSSYDGQDVSSPSFKNGSTSNPPYRSRSVGYPPLARDEFPPPQADYGRSDDFRRERDRQYRGSTSRGVESLRSSSVNAKASFEKEFPTLGAQPKPAHADASWRAPLLNPLPVPDQQWTSKLADLPPPQQQVTPQAAPEPAPAPAPSLNAYAAAAGPRLGGVAAAGGKEDKREQLAVRQSKQLVPMVAGAKAKQPIVNKGEVLLRSKSVPGGKPDVARAGMAAAKVPPPVVVGATDSKGGRNMFFMSLRKKAAVGAAATSPTAFGGTDTAPTANGHHASSNGSSQPAPADGLSQQLSETSLDANVNGNGSSVAQPAAGSRGSLDMNDPRLTIPPEEEAFLRSLGWSEAEVEDDAEFGLTEDEIRQFQELKDQVMQQRASATNSPAPGTTSSFAVPYRGSSGNVPTGLDMLDDVSSSDSDNE